MATFHIVPESDWAALSQYLNIATVLIPQHVVDSLPPEAAERVQRANENGSVDYDFGGEPDVLLDIIYSQHSYAFQTLFSKATDDDPMSST